MFVISKLDFPQLVKIQLNANTSKARRGRREKEEDRESEICIFGGENFEQTVGLPSRLSKLASGVQSSFSLNEVLVMHSLAPSSQGRGAKRRSNFDGEFMCLAIVRCCDGSYGE